MSCGDTGDTLGKRSPIRARIGWFGFAGIYPAGLIHEKAGLINTKSALRRPFGWNRHPAGSKKSLISTNWRHDRRPDQAVLLEMEKNPCFDPHSGSLLRRAPTCISGLECVRQSWQAAAINLRAELLFLIVLSDGGVITRLPLKEGPDPDSGHNSRKCGHNSTFSLVSPT
jgi:hypothetical protein